MKENHHAGDETDCDRSICREEPEGDVNENHIRFQHDGRHFFWWFQAETKQARQVDGQKAGVLSFLYKICAPRHPNGSQAV